MRKSGLHSVLQKYDYDCGTACVYAILKTKKVSDLSNYNEFINEMGLTREFGTSPDNIRQILEKYSLDYDEFNNSSLEKLCEAVDEGKYCLVTFQAYWNSQKERDEIESGHYSVVYKRSKDFLYLMDPSARKTGGFRRLSKQKFIKEWIDKDYLGNIYSHWFIAI